MKYLLFALLSFTALNCKAQSKDTTFSKEQTIALLNRLADTIKKDQPDAAIVLLNLVSCMHINQQRALATESIRVTGELIKRLQSQMGLSVPSRPRRPSLQCCRSIE